MREASASRAQVPLAARDFGGPGHLIVAERPERLAGPITGFLAGVHVG
jgi:hypothetical protein